VSPKRRSRAADARAALRELDHRISDIDAELQHARVLRDERRRLINAKAALSGEPLSPTGAQRITQEHVAEYLRQHGPAGPLEIARALKASQSSVSMHLYRGKNDRFTRTAEGWDLADRTARS